MWEVCDVCTYVRDYTLLYVQYGLFSDVLHAHNSY